MVVLVTAPPVPLPGSDRDTGNAYARASALSVASRSLVCVAYGGWCSVVGPYASGGYSG